MKEKFFLWKTKESLICHRGCAVSIGLRKCEVKDMSIGLFSSQKLLENNAIVFLFSFDKYCLIIE